MRNLKSMDIDTELDFKIAEILGGRVRYRPLHRITRDPRNFREVCAA